MPLYDMNGTHFADLARKRDAEDSSQKKTQSVTPPDIFHDSYRYSDLEELAPPVLATSHEAVSAGNPTSTPRTPSTTFYITGPHKDNTRN